MESDAYKKQGTKFLERMLGEWVPSRLTEFSIDASPSSSQTNDVAKGSTAGTESPRSKAPAFRRH